MKQAAADIAPASRLSNLSVRTTLPVGSYTVQVWVPDVHAPGFQAEIRRQVRRLDPAHETDALDFIAAVAEDPSR